MTTRRPHHTAAALIACALALPVASCTTSDTARQGERPGMRLNDFVVEADSALEMGERDEAIRLLAAAIEANPEFTPAYVRLGEIQFEDANYDGAERTYSSLVRLEPRVFDHQYFHALALHHLERLSEAVRAYLRALALEPASFDAHLNLSTAYLQLDEHAQSLPYAREAVEIDPDSGTAWANLGAALTGLDARDADLEAVRAFETAAELTEADPEYILKNWAIVLGRLDRFREMINVLERSLEISESAFAWERIGFARFKLREFENAELSFRSALQVDPNHYPARNGLGVCLLNDWIADGRNNNALKREAIDHLRASLRVNGQQPKIVNLLSRFG